MQYDTLRAVIRIRLDPGGMFVNAFLPPSKDFLSIRRYASYYPVSIGRDDDNSPAELDLFADVDAQTPKRIESQP
jgi:hypothetical protein